MPTTKVVKTLGMAAVQMAKRLPWGLTMLDVLPCVVATNWVS